MIISISRPSAMDARIVADKGSKDNELMIVKPRRFSKSQRKVNLFPFEVQAETPGGGVLDQGYILLDTRTGKLVIEHRNEEIPIEEKKNG
jgi:hypothetical protein